MERKREREFVTRATNDVPLARSPVSPFEDPTRRRQVVIQSPNLPAHDFACKPTSSYSHSARDQTAYTATTRRLPSSSALKTIIFSLYLHGTNCTIVTIPCSRGPTINVVEISSNLSSPGDIPTALPADSTNYYYYYYIPSSHLVQLVRLVSKGARFFFFLFLFFFGIISVIINFPLLSKKVTIHHLPPVSSVDEPSSGDDIKTALSNSSPGQENFSQT